MTGPRPLSDIPDAPGGWPLLGHLLPLSRDLPRVLRATDEGAPLQRLRLPFSFDIYLWTEDEAFGLLSDKGVSNQHQGTLSEALIGPLSMLASDGADHRRRRQASQAPFTPRGLSMSGVSDVMAEVIERRVGELLARPQVKMLEETQTLALEILFRLLGIPQDELREWARRYNHMIMAALGPKWDVPGLPWRRALKAQAWVDERLGRYVEDARNNPDAQGLVPELVRGRDDEGKGLSDGEIFANLRTLILAGHETTASVMAWMVAYLTRDSELYERLRTEAIETEGLPRSPKELERFPLAEAVFREALRLHTPATLNSRTLLEPRVIGGYELPAGTAVGIALWRMNRDPATWADPERFDPQRWIRQKRRYSSVETSAFGGGPHFCLGYHMALVEAVQFIVTLVRGLDAAGLSLQMDRMPREVYLPLLRPRMNDTRCRFVPA